LEPRSIRRAWDRQVGDERVEFAVGLGVEQHFEPSFKLVCSESPLRGRLP
jgi:hypothetical protein